MSEYPSLLVNGFLVVNITVSCGVGWVCLCRMSLMDKRDTRKMFRFWYVLMFVAAAANVVGHWAFGEQPGPGALLFSFALLGHLCSTYRMWRRGVPAIGRTMPMDLMNDSDFQR